MGIYTLPKRLHPDFALPGVKPKGPVEIDWDHPLAKGLTSAHIATASGFVDLVSGALADNQDQAVPAVIDGVLTLSKTGTTLEVKSDVDPHAHGGLFSCIVKLHSGTQPAGSSSGITGTISGSATGFEIMRNNTTEAIWWATENRWAVNTTSGTLADDETATIGLISSSGSVRVFKNEDVVDNDATAGGNIASSNPLVVGGRGDDTGFEQGKFDYHYCYTYNRALSDEEYLTIESDPYQILKPATPLSYFVPAAAGGQSILPLIVNAHEMNQTGGTL